MKQEHLIEKLYFILEDFGRKVEQEGGSWDLVSFKGFLAEKLIKIRRQDANIDDL